jgi:hypothetical protein
MCVCAEGGTEIPLMQGYILCVPQSKSDVAMCMPTEPCQLATPPPHNPHLCLQVFHKGLYLCRVT